MPWLRLDDRFTKHPKVLKLQRGDRWTWLEILEYCAAYQTGGQVPRAIRDVIPHASSAFIEQCVDAGLLDTADRFPAGSAGSHDPDPGGYQVHDWLVYNPPRIEGEDLERRVADALDEHPDASANEVHRMVGGRKQAVLDLVKRFRTGSAPVPERFQSSVPGTTREPVTRAGAHARPVPVPNPYTPSPNPFPADDDEELNKALHGIPLAGPARTTALELLATDPARLAACVTASLTAGKPAAYLAELLRNGSHPQPPRPEPRAPDPTSVCPDCGEKLGHGHLETCPRMPATTDAPEPDPDPEPKINVPSDQTTKEAA